MARLLGQHFDSLLRALRGDKAPTRADIDGTMTTATQPLSREDIASVAEYIADPFRTPWPAAIRTPLLPGKDLKISPMGQYAVYQAVRGWLDA